MAATNNWFTGRTQKAASAPADPKSEAVPAAAPTAKEKPAVRPAPAASAATPAAGVPAVAKPAGAASPTAKPAPASRPAATAPSVPATPSSNGARPAGTFSNTFRAPGAGPVGTAQRPVDASPWAAAKPPKKKQRRNKRQAHLTVARVEPWSVMKFSFVVSVVAFIVLFVAVAVLYGVLSSLGVFTSLQHLVSTVTSSKSSGGTNITGWFSASRILGYTGMLGAVNIVLITAMATIGSVVYNLIAKAFGGVEITLRETD